MRVEIIHIQNNSYHKIRLDLRIDRISSNLLIRLVVVILKQATTSRWTLELRMRILRESSMKVLEAKCSTTYRWWRRIISRIGDLVCHHWRKLKAWVSESASETIDIFRLYVPPRVRASPRQHSCSTMENLQIIIIHKRTWRIWRTILQAKFITRKSSWPSSKNSDLT